MSLCLSPPLEVPVGASVGTRSPDEQLRIRVHSLILAASRPQAEAERRHDRRYPYARLITLIPTDPCGTSPTGETVVVVGKHLSPGGVGFYHSAPLPYRHVIAVFGDGRGDRTGLLTHLTWCRFTGKGWYENGGRFLRVVERKTCEKDFGMAANVT